MTNYTDLPLITAKAREETAFPFVYLLTQGKNVRKRDREKPPTEAETEAPLCGGNMPGLSLVNRINKS